MTVEEVHVGPRRVEIDPKNPKEKKAGDPGYWEDQKVQERAKREFLEEQEMISRLKNPPAAEAPFQIKGSVNLGDIDMQAQAKKAEDAAAAASKKAEDAAIAEREASQKRIDTLTEEANKAKEALHNAELQRVSEQLSNKIEALQKAITGGNQKTIIEQLADVDTLAGKLGYLKPQAGPSSGDPHLMIELKKLEQIMAVDDRNFQARMAQDGREWTLKLRELDQNKVIADEKLAAERDKWKAISSIPTQLGTAVAKGLVQEGGAAAGAVQAKGKKPVVISANKGESGELDCPNCGTLVAIGPTARGAVCASCNQQFSINRNPSLAPPATPPTPTLTPEEGEVEE